MTTCSNAHFVAWLTRPSKPFYKQKGNGFSFAYMWRQRPFVNAGFSQQCVNEKGFGIRYGHCV